MTETPSGAVEPASGVVSRPSPVPGRIFITGGTGFVGRQICSQLAGRPLRLLVRDSTRHRDLRRDDVELSEGDVTSAASLADAMRGCQTVIHLVAIIEERGDATFDRVIRQGTEHVVGAARASGISRFLHMSAMGAVHDPRYGYLEAKWQAEQAVQASDIAWTIFRPSVIFGPGDGFINALAGVVRRLPVIPVVGTGRSKFQPVSVKDVAAAFTRALDDASTADCIFELGGPDILTYEQLLDVIAAKLGKHKPKLHVPVAVMLPVVRLSKPLPTALRPPVTVEQLKMLSLDNCTDHSSTAALIGLSPLRLADGIDYITESKAPE